jgi:hypothetical protein
VPPVAGAGVIRTTPMGPTCTGVYAPAADFDAWRRKFFSLRHTGRKSLMTGAADSHKVAATTAVPERDEQGTGCGRYFTANAPAAPATVSG